MNRSLAFTDRPRAASWLSRADLLFALVVLTIWTSVAPVAYLFQVGSFGIVPYEIFEALAIVACVVMWSRRPETFVWPPGAWWLVGFMALTSASAIFADNMRTVITVLGRFWLGWIVFFLLPSAVTTRRQLRSLVGAMLVQAAVLVGLTLGAVLGYFGLPALPPVLMIQFQKNEYATYLAFAVAISLVAFNWRFTSVWARRLAIVVAVLAVVSWSFTYSRSGLVALLGTMGLMVALTRTRRVAVEVGTLLMIGAIVWLALPSEVQLTSARALKSMAPSRMGSALEVPRDEIETSDPFRQTIEERFVLDRAAVETILAHPITGLGLTQWEAFSPVKVEIFDVKRWHPISVGATIHNRLLLIAAESGLPTLALYLGFVGSLLWRAWGLRFRVDREMRFILDALFACSVALQVAMIAMPGTLWEYNQMAVLATVIIIAEQETKIGAPSPVAG